MIIKPSAVPIFLNPTTSFYLGIVPQQIDAQHQSNHKILPSPTTPFRRFLTLFQKKEKSPGVIETGITKELIQNNPHRFWHPNHGTEHLKELPSNPFKSFEFENASYETIGTIDHGSECTVYRLKALAPELPWSIIKIKGGIRESIMCGSQALFTNFANPRLPFDPKNKIDLFSQINKAFAQTPIEKCTPEILCHGNEYIVMEYICGPNYYQLKDSMWGFSKEQITEAKKKLKILINAIRACGIECDFNWKRNYIYQIIGKDGNQLEPEQFRWFFVDP
ncbi:MAG: hypothetical protein ABIE74_10725 [Pseudomonadota bacterium]